MCVFRFCPRVLNRECIRSKTRVFCMPIVVSSNKQVTLIVIALAAMARADALKRGDLIGENNACLEYKTGDVLL